MKKKPHILIFNPDQWRSDVMGHMGNPAAVTPYLDQLVETDGVSFRNAFCQNTVCTPSRCSFMSGWYPHVRGHRTMYHMMQPEEPVLLKTLKEEGYFVWWGGKNDLVPAEIGFEKYCDIKYQPARTPRRETNLHAHDVWRGTSEADNYFSFYAGKLEKGEEEETYYDGDWANVLGAIDMIRHAPSDKPLCIYLPLLYPHPPYGVEEPYFSMIDRDMLPPRIPAPQDWSTKPSLMKGIYEQQHLQGWTEERWNELRATYYGMCARVDKQFAMVNELDELYDLINDPGETVNRINDPGMADVLAELKERLLTFYQETCDAVPHYTNKRG
ncbi:sulfatase-like hydrolase/transferase [Paenibacillus sp. FSL H7-0331]|uniref:sulfatase-like hydrolase/transferase n=1 Tax=Paenibacillus sp. FSL H7-0331 TaxID=1920421 RepID=UPI00096C193D|nr:sulfatase-like hydrolase/transferase [Paenibacillus sp. FSL H7-0331]OMF05775.1 hypothetical protein BK127_32165 [Paenibacillus sp. FSL H7-0331]